MVELQTGEKQTRVGEKLSELTIRKVGGVVAERMQTLRKPTPKDPT